MNVSQLFLVPRGTIVMLKNTTVQYIYQIFDSTNKTEGTNTLLSFKQLISQCTLLTDDIVYCPAPMVAIVLVMSTTPSTKNNYDETVITMHPSKNDYNGIKMATTPLSQRG